VTEQPTEPAQTEEPAPDGTEEPVENP
jgi:hypothetical protein